MVKSVSFWPILVVLFGGFLGPLVAASPTKAQLNDMPVTSGSGQALEGDLVSVNGSAIRLWGVDAPDMGQKCQNSRGADYDCFEAARAALERFIGGRTVDCHIRGKDSFGQPVATCGVAGYDLAALMARAGWAMAFQRLAPEYAVLEGQAQARGRGVWVGTAEAPWDWRRKNSVKRE